MDKEHLERDGAKGRTSATSAHVLDVLDVLNLDLATWRDWRHAYVLLGGTKCPGADSGLGEGGASEVDM